MWLCVVIQYLVICSQIIRLREVHRISKWNKQVKFLTNYLFHFDILWTSRIWMKRTDLNNLTKSNRHTPRQLCWLNSVINLYICSWSVDESRNVYSIILCQFHIDSNLRGAVSSKVTSTAAIVADHIAGAAAFPGYVSGAPTAVASSLRS